MPGGRGDEAPEESIIVVPLAPGTLVRPGAGRHRDGLDDLIDEFLPDTDEGPGPVDATLIAGGGALLAWTLLGAAPAIATVAGGIALGLGCILPLRAVWRGVAGRRRSKRLTRGVAMRADEPALARLVTAYDALDALGVTSAAARAAAHGAVLEVASLLAGRLPATDSERHYVAARVTAVEQLAEALRELPVPVAGSAEEPAGVEPGLMVAAREELDALGVSALSHLEGVTADERARGRHR